MQTAVKIILSAGLVLNACTAYADVVVVVVSAKSSVQGLTADQVSQIFLGKTNTFPDGTVVVPLDQADNAAERNAFYAKVTGKDPMQLKSYRSKLIFTGKGQPPKELPGNSEVKKAVASDPAAIGYIDKGAVDSSVRVVLTP